MPDNNNRMSLCLQGEGCTSGLKFQLSKNEGIFEILKFEFIEIHEITKNNFVTFNSVQLYRTIVNKL